jgi:monoamine oxidase
VLNDLEEIHGPIVKQYFQEGVVYVWNKDPHSHGGFIRWALSQKHTFLVSTVHLVRY